jgi:octanoyl-[GcvH]:protein N-octanoyltransferase
VLHGIARWRLLDEPEVRDPAERVAVDALLLEAVRSGAAPATARIWENARCLVVARSDRRLPRFEAARAELAAAGWPVIVRESGGTAVPHGPGILSLSLAFRPPRSRRCTIESGYDAVCRPLEAALASLGVASERREVKGAFCDGRFDLAVSGRKIAGTAQRWRAGPGGPAPERGAVLAHAVWLVDADRAAAAAALDRFYAAAGAPRRCDPRASITLREALAAAGRPLGRAEPAALAAAARDALRDALRALAGCA